MALPRWVGPVNLALTAFALAVLVAVVAVMATVPVEHWQSGTATWAVQYQACDGSLCPIQQGYLQLPVGANAVLHWNVSRGPVSLQFWLMTAAGATVFYCNSTSAVFEYTTVDSPYKLAMVVPHPLNGTATLELEYSFSTSAPLL